MSRPVVVVGDVMNDVIVRPLGPVAVGTDTPSNIARSPGGSGANQAAWLGSLGVGVRLVARVGATDAAEHRAALARCGVEAHLVESAGGVPTGTVVALIGPDGERSMFTDRGANVAAGDTDLPLEVLAGAVLLHVSGYQLFLESTRRALRPLWDMALSAGVPVAVDPGSVAGLREMGAPAFFEATAGATLLLPNLDEGRFLAGLEEPAGVVDQLLEHYPVVALKLGAGGAIAMTADGSVRAEAMAAPAGAVVDTTGAGDAFCAGFIARWIAGDRVDDCLQGGVTLAGRAVRQLGARPPAG